jgi:hypothetical protein
MNGLLEIEIDVVVGLQNFVMKMFEIIAIGCKGKMNVKFEKNRFSIGDLNVERNHENLKCATAAITDICQNCDGQISVEFEICDTKLEGCRSRNEHRKQHDHQD